jgi:hypothetical protein
MGVAPSRTQSGLEEGLAASLPIGSDKTIGGWKGHFSGRFGLPFFQAHRYTGLYDAPKEKIKAKSAYRLN